MKAVWVIGVLGIALVLTGARMGQAADSPAEKTKGPPKRVLVVHSFGREYAPFDVRWATFRTELARRCPVPVAFQ